MQPLLTNAQMREADAYTIGTIGIGAEVLMEHAALGVVDYLNNRYGNSLPHRKILFVAGWGNNGGDAFAVARILLNRGIQSHVLALHPEKLKGIALKQKAIWEKIASPVLDSIPGNLNTYDLIVDGLFGTGLKRNIEGKLAQVIAQLNQAKGEIISIDIPSGLDADTGCPLGISVVASGTVSLGFLKPGQLTGQAANYVGDLVLCPIQIPRQIPGIKPAAQLCERGDLARLIPQRKPAGHKGSFGHVYVMAGVAQTQGACALAALGALRAGTGRVTLLGDSLDQLRPRLAPEIMTQSFSLEQLKAGRETIVVGPGFGLEPGHWDKLCQLLESGHPLVVDADGLTLMSQNEATACKLIAERTKVPTVLTPHPAEAARLLASDTVSVENDRIGAISKLIDKWQVTFILKGKGSVIAAPGTETWIIQQGNTALSKGGTGDVLAGVVGSLLAQGCSAVEASALGAYLHGRSAELISEHLGTERSALASEIAERIPDVWKELEKN